MENQIRSRDTKLIPIGNSRGVRIPKALLQKYSLKDTYKAMADEKEHWEDFDITLPDGLWSSSVRTK